MVEKSTRRGGFQTLLNASCSLIFILLFCNREGVFLNPLRHRSSDLLSSWKSRECGVHPHRRIAEVSYDRSSGSSDEAVGDKLELVKDLSAICSDVARYEGSDAKCKFLRSNGQCYSDGFFDYLSFFYCTCENLPALGYVVLGLWLVSLFYMLGNTAADYFCCSLANVSRLLRLSPTVSGVTLLPLGNGAPDVCASIAAFMGSGGSGGIGINSVLGGATFVTCVVVGTVSFCVANKNVQIDRKCFIRDVGFFLFTLVSLSIILIVGKVSVWGAVMFVMIYVVYAFVVAANELLRKHAERFKLATLTPLLPVRGKIFSCGSDELSMYSHLLDDGTVSDAPYLPALPQWMWTSHVAIYSNQAIGDCSLEKPSSPWSLNEEEKTDTRMLDRILYILEMPLSLPRRLTIPVADEERWSKVIFLEAGEARAAFKGLSYKRYKDAPLYLEWAPSDILSPNTKFQTEEQNNVVDEESVKKVILEQSVEGIPEEEIDPDRMESRSLFVKNLNFKTADESLKKHFSDKMKSGAIRSVKVKKHKKDGKDVSMGFGFIEFDSVETANTTCKDLQGTVLDAHALILQLCHSRKAEQVPKRDEKNKSSTTLMVKNVAFEATTKDLRQLFNPFGQIKSLRLPVKFGGHHKGYAFVEFVTKQEAKTAMENLSNTHLYGRHLVIERAKEKETMEDLRAKAAAHFAVDNGGLSKKRKQITVAEKADKIARTV